MSYDAPGKPCRTPWRMSFTALQLNPWQVPKDCPPISWNWPTNLAAPSPRSSSQLLSEVEFSCQDAHRSPIQGSPDDDRNDNSAKNCAEEAVTRRNLESLQLSLKLYPPAERQQGHTSLQCIIYKRHIYIDSVRRPCLFLSDHQMTCPRQWTCQEQSADMVANFGSMYKISPGDAQAQRPARRPPKYTWEIPTWPICNQLPYIWKHNVCTIINVTTKQQLDHPHDQSPCQRITMWPEI